MSSSAESSSSPGSLPELLSEWKGNLVRNSTSAVTRLTPQGWIRLILVVGAYLLLRPYLMELGARMQEKQHEKEAAARKKTDADIHPNELRTGKKFAIPGVDDEEEDDDEEDYLPADWGKKARLRQRKFVRNAMEEAEERLLNEQEEADIQDILDLLED